MTASTVDFVYSTAPEPHRARTKEILQRHPEIRELIGHNPATFFWTVGIVAFQFALALVCDQPLLVARGPAGLLCGRLRESRALRDDP